ncbi:MAG: hypothetical protein ABSF46_22850 [Terriglobia bacterium]|jgi:G3E family GTPase
MKKVIILGAAGRDFHNFNVVFRDDPAYRVVAFTAAGHELSYYSGEVNFRRAEVLVINNVDTAGQEAIEAVRSNIRKINPGAQVIETECRVTVAEPERIKGQRARRGPGRRRSREGVVARASRPRSRGHLALARERDAPATAGETPAPQVFWKTVERI